MNLRNPVLTGPLLAGALVVCFAYAATGLVPRARTVVQEEGALHRELEGLTRALQLDRVDSDAPLEHASELLRRAEIEAQQLAHRIADASAAPPSTSAAAKAAWVSEIAEKTGWPKERIESWMPSAETSPEEAAAQMVTVRDLAITAGHSGIEFVVFLRFPRDKPGRATEYFGEWLPTFPVRLEYRAPETAHRSFLGGLLARRDAGPLYTIEDLRIEADPLASALTKSDRVKTDSAQVVVRLTLRRIVGAVR